MPLELAEEEADPASAEDDETESQKKSAASTSAPQRSRFPSRRQRHPFRQMATPQALADKPTESLGRPAGWMEPLPRTARQTPAAE